MQIISFSANMKKQQAILEGTLAEIERKLAPLQVENYAVINRNGIYIAGDTFGKKDSIIISPLNKYEIENETNRGVKCIVTHNHPDRSPLSPQDVMIGFLYKLLQVRSVDTPINGFIKRHILDMPEKMNQADAQKGVKMSLSFIEELKKLDENPKTKALNERCQDMLKKVVSEFNAKHSNNIYSTEEFNLLWEAKDRKKENIKNHFDSLFKKYIIDPFIEKMNKTFEKTFQGLKFREEFLPVENSNIITSFLQIADREVV